MLGFSYDWDRELATTDIEQRPPPAKYPARLTNDESAAIAVKQKSSLSLS